MAWRCSVATQHKLDDLTTKLKSYLRYGLSKTIQDVTKASSAVTAYSEAVKKTFNTLHTQIQILHQALSESSEEASELHALYIHFFEKLSSTIQSRRQHQIPHLKVHHNLLRPDLKK